MVPDPYIEHLTKRYNNPAFVDEVGKSAVFGEHVACAVMLPIEFNIEEVDDSKKLKHETIYRLAEKIRPMVHFGLGIVSCLELKSIRNMHRANLLAMKRAIENLPLIPDAVFIDGKYPVGGITAPIYTVIQGDSKVFGIAVASIIAKDFRDHLMITKYGQRYSQYYISSNKGYRSPAHLTSIRRWGITDYHRIWMPQVQKVVSGEYDTIIQNKYLKHWNS